MALLRVNGVDLPTPTELSFGKYDISKAERNARGTMIIERITTKIKISVKYNYLTADDVSKVLKALALTYWDVTFLDPVKNVYVTSSFYAGDRNLGMIDYANGEARYKDLSFDLIER